MMERVTVDYGKQFSPFRYAMKDGSDAEIGYFKNYDAFYSHMLMVQKLGEYEDLVEQGLLLRLPCKVGDTVYSIANDGKIYPVKVTREVRIVNGGLHIICESCRYSDLLSYDDIGKTVFLTQEEAAQKLKEMESD